MQESKFFTIFGIALALFIVTSFIFSSTVKRDDVSVPSQVVSYPFESISLQAKSVYVYDARTKTVLFAHNENVRRPLASLTKLMSALVAQELSPSYGTVIVGQAALAAEGDSSLKEGERWSLKNLLDFSLVSSSNDGIRAVALALGAIRSSEASTSEIIKDFVFQMNRKAGELDLKNTYFWNETGLDESELKGGAYGTVKDMAALMEYIITYQPEMLEATRDTSGTFSSLDDLNHVAKNTNSLAGEIPGFLGSKTGFTSTAGGNLVLAFDPELGRPIIISILGSTEHGRFEDAWMLINATLRHISNTQ